MSAKAVKDVIILMMVLIMMMMMRRRRRRRRRGEIAFVVIVEMRTITLEMGIKTKVIIMVVMNRIIRIMFVIGRRIMMIKIIIMTIMIVVIKWRY